MTSSFILLPEFTIVGLAVRTSNKDGQSKNDLTHLWTKFMGENTMAQIPHKISEELYCVYTDYETDWKGPYTCFLGCKVSSILGIPNGFAHKTIPSTKYLKFESIGKLPDAVLATWDGIWKTDLNRAYIADFDVYGKNAQDSSNALVETFVSIG
jgi:predicted transcriptional regulator YdeE